MSDPGVSAETTQPTCKVGDLEPGDVLFFKGDNLVSNGQWLLAPFTGASPGTFEYIHVAMVSPRQSIVSHRKLIIEATNAENQSGIREIDLAECLRLYLGATDAFAFRNVTGADERTLASVNARTWCRGNANTIRYSTTKSLRLGGFGNSAYGSHAKRRADFYHQQSDKGVLDSDPISKKRFFCSMFVIAAYQSVYGANKWTAENMALDASRTSPMRLATYFLENPTAWTSLGKVEF